MNSKTTKKLRKLYVNPFEKDDPRSKTAWRSFKREFNKVPRDKRFQFLEGMQKLVDIFKKQKELNKINA